MENVSFTDEQFATLISAIKPMGLAAPTPTPEVDIDRSFASEIIQLTLRNRYWGQDMTAFQSQILELAKSKI